MAGNKKTNERFYPKELSWLSFNGRVLQEASDPKVPLIEKIRFLGIYSSNQDEFFKVRVADLKRDVIINKQRHKDGFNPSLLLRDVQKRASEYQIIVDRIYDDLKDELAANQIFLKDEAEVTVSQRRYLRRYFKHHVLKHINPVIITDTTDLVSFLKDEYTYLLVRMSGRHVSHALIEIPSDVLPRFVSIPSSDASFTLMYLDDVIRIGLNDVFDGIFTYSSIEAYAIKLNRDAEYDLSGSMDKSLLESMSDSIRQRLYAMPVRFAYDKEMPDDTLRFIASKFKMTRMDSLMPGGRYHNFKDFLSFPSLGRGGFEYPVLPTIQCYDFDHARTPFEAIARRDILLYYPYYSFDHFTEFLRVSSYDPRVASIKINIYRVASNSRVIDSLIDAANNGKSVTVVVELKARFDEVNNIKWASRMTENGVKVLFGMPTLKIHSKLCLVTRIEDGELVRYAHIGTGNFNEKTAKIYTDFALFTVNPEITREVDGVFESIEYPYARHNFHNLLVSPINARKNITALIDREIEHARAGQEAYIRLKVNNLVDTPLIERLYRASRAGVRVRAVVRGMCSLRAGVPGLSDNIFITSIVDKYLEHPRVMIFCNRGQPDVYITSADWMTRNLDNRIEVGTRILDPRLRERIITIFTIQASDNQKARIVDASQDNRYVRPQAGEAEVRSQTAIYDYLNEVEMTQPPPGEEHDADAQAAAQREAF